MKRILREALFEDVRNKIILLSGPRQVGKTTLAKSINSDFNYFNLDLVEHIQEIRQKNWDRKKQLVIFDELHKVKNWKRWLKGIYDTESKPPYIVVTGSAKMDSYRKVGDSLAGRHFQFRLHPFDLWELAELGYALTPQVTLEKLMFVSGFPEPFIREKREFYRRWRKTHQDIILRQDLLDEQSVRSIRAIELLTELLQVRVGTHLSFKSLSEDLDYSDKTVRRWISLLEESYVLFSVLPFHKSIARSQKKAPKIYFYDFASLKSEGAKFENLVAAALLKQCHYRSDVRGEDWGLRYVRTKERKEIDFLILKNGEPEIAIEVKLSNSNLSPNFKEISKYYPNVKKIQLVLNLDRERTFPDGSEVRFASKWLSEMRW